MKTTSEVSDFELKTLIEWYRDEQFKASDKQDYLTAADYVKRIAEIQVELKTREAEKYV